MADQPAKQKRIVKNPETFRERAIKASEAGDKPSRASQIRGFGGKAVSPVATPLGKVGGRVARFKPVRWLGLILFPRYFRNSWHELKLVKWPTWKESRRLTFAVILFAVVFGAVIASVDYGLDKLFKNILLK